MDAAIQRSLLQLLPTVPSPYPRSLITTASTIHALSRKKIPLRPDEEASRLLLASFIAAERSPPHPPLLATNEDTNGRLATVLNLPPPKLSKSTPITIPEKGFRLLLGTFRTAIPADLITAPTTTKRGEKRLDVSKKISQLCTKIQCPVSQSYFANVLDPILARHSRRESVDVIIAATFLILTTYKDGTQKKLSPTDKKKVIEAFDGRFQSKEVSDWIRVIEGDLEEMKWFERNPIETGIAESRKRKSEGDIKNKKGKLAKNISGVGIMVCLVKC
jgi:hypothetical protein